MSRSATTVVFLTLLALMLLHLVFTITVRSNNYITMAIRMVTSESVTSDGDEVTRMSILSFL